MTESATGSAAAGADDGPVADSSGRSAEANGPAARVPATWAPINTLWDKLQALRYCIENNYWEDSLAHLHDLSVYVALNKPDTSRRSVK
jgi:hypothetical protein